MPKDVRNYDIPQITDDSGKQFYPHIRFVIFKPNY